MGTRRPPHPVSRLRRVLYSRVRAQGLRTVLSPHTLCNQATLSAMRAHSDVPDMGIMLLRRTGLLSSRSLPPPPTTLLQIAPLPSASTHPGCSPAISILFMGRLVSDM